MKFIPVLLFNLLLSTVFGQTANSSALLDSAKTWFKAEKDVNQEQLDKFDYNRILHALNTFIELEPQNAEAHYYLGYTYSRINSRDGRSMINMNSELVKMASQEFELVNKLSPKYTGEIIVLDPYSKLTAEWGSLAMSYWHKHQNDSALWAFQEGKKRGGFGEFILAANRKVLDACSKNALLISSGDNFTIPLWYLQIVEGYRKDVTVIDISLLNAGWYPGYLSKNNIAKFDFPNEVLDTLDYIKWQDSVITINHFSWTVKPSYYDSYLLRGDRLFLSLLKANNFEKEVYFTIAFMEDSRLSLTDHLRHLTIVDKLANKETADQTFKQYKKAIKKVLQLSKTINLNSSDELNFLNCFRFDVFQKTNNCISDNEKKKAKELLKLLDKYANENTFPYLDENASKYLNYLKGQLY